MLCRDGGEEGEGGGGGEAGEEGGRDLETMKLKYYIKKSYNCVKLFR